VRTTVRMDTAGAGHGSDVHGSVSWIKDLCALSRRQASRSKGRMLLLPVAPVDCLLAA